MTLAWDSVEQRPLPGYGSMYDFSLGWISVEQRPLHGYGSMYDFSLGLNRTMTTPWVWIYVWTLAWDWSCMTLDHSMGMDLCMTLAWNNDHSLGMDLCMTLAWDSVEQRPLHGYGSMYDFSLGLSRTMTTPWVWIYV